MISWRLPLLSSCGSVFDNCCIDDALRGRPFTDVASSFATRLAETFSPMAAQVSILRSPSNGPGPLFAKTAGAASATKADIKSVHDDGMSPQMAVEFSPVQRISCTSMDPHVDLCQYYYSLSANPGSDRGIFFQIIYFCYTAPTSLAFRSQRMRFPKQNQACKNRFLEKQVRGRPGSERVPSKLQIVVWNCRALLSQKPPAAGHW